MADPGDLTCQEFVELVTDYLESALSPAERARFEGHFADCDDCPLYLEQMRQTIRAIGRLRADQIAPAARQRLLAEFRDWKRTRVTGDG